VTYPSGPANTGYPSSPGPAPLTPTPDVSGQFRLADMASPPRRKLWPWIAAAIVVLVLAAGVAVWFLRPETPVGSSTKLTLASAAAACQEKVKAQLKAPGTAKFGGEEYSTTNTDTPVRVSGWVDAENSFGALVRNRYSCLAMPTDHGWSVGDVTFSDW
jgi:hypothetical protein